MTENEVDKAFREIAAGFDRWDRQIEEYRVTNEELRLTCSGLRERIAILEQQLKVVQMALARASEGLPV